LGSAHGRFTPEIGRRIAWRAARGLRQALYVPWERQSMQQRSVQHWFRRYDWDAVAGIAAAVVALILHLLHVVQLDILLTITLVLVALLLLRQLRHRSPDPK